MRMYFLIPASLVNLCDQIHQGTLLLTWINFIANMDKWSHARKVGDEIHYPFPNFNGWTVGFLEWISNIIPYFIMDVITYPYWDKS